MTDVLSVTYLYVEDDSLSRQVMEMIMYNAVGLPEEQFIVFENSERFIERVQELDQVPDIFLLDVQVSPLNGFEMLAQLRVLPQTRDRTVIALTASVMNEEIQALRDAGFDGAISKPVSVTTLPELLSQIVRGESVWHIGS